MATNADTDESNSATKDESKSKNKEKKKRTTEGESQTTSLDEIDTKEEPVSDIKDEPKSATEGGHNSAANDEPHTSETNLTEGQNVITEGESQTASLDEIDTKEEPISDTKDEPTAATEGEHNSAANDEPHTSETNLTESQNVIRFKLILWSPGQGGNRQDQPVADAALHANMNFDTDNAKECDTLYFFTSKMSETTLTLLSDKGYNVVNQAYAHLKDAAIVSTSEPSTIERIPLEDQRDRFHEVERVQRGRIDKLVVHELVKLERFEAVVYRNKLLLICVHATSHEKLPGKVERLKRIWELGKALMSKHGCQGMILAGDFNVLRDKLNFIDNTTVMTRQPDRSMYFNKSKRVIDYVLAYPNKLFKISPATDKKIEPFDHPVFEFDIELKWKQEPSGKLPIKKEETFQSADVCCESCATLKTRVDELEQKFEQLLNFHLEQSRNSRDRLEKMLDN